MAIPNPKTYKHNKVKPCKLKKPKSFLSGITNEIKIAYTGNPADQVINGVTKIDFNRPLSTEIVIVA